MKQAIDAVAQRPLGYAARQGFLRSPLQLSWNPAEEVGPMGHASSHLAAKVATKCQCEYATDLVEVVAFQASCHPSRQR